MNYNMSVSTKSEKSLKNKIKVASRINESDLLKLANGDILALRIPNYITDFQALKLAKNLKQSPMLDHYKVNPGVAKVGMTLFDSNKNPELRNQYHNNVRMNSNMLRLACGDVKNPLDTLMDEIKANTSTGICIEELDGRSMSVGVCRICEIGSDIPTHQDILSEDAPYAESPKELLAQMSANIFLSTADDGGELILWDKSFSTTIYGITNLERGHGLDKNLLPAPSVIIKPKVGELIVFNSTYAHAVTKINKGIRITLATFIGYRGFHSPWSFWS